jgi:hypothetical protein
MAAEIPHLIQEGLIKHKEDTAPMSPAGAASPANDSAASSSSSSSGGAKQQQ